MTADHAGDMLRALADPPRLRLLALLSEHGTLCVCELEQVTGLAQYTVSRNLGILRRAGLVQGRRNGARMDYQVCADMTTAVASLVQAAIGLLADDRLLADQSDAARHARRRCASISAS